MPPSEAQKRATAKWRQEKTDEIRFRAPKGLKERIHECAAKNGESVTGYLIRVVTDAIEAER